MSENREKTGQNVGDYRETLNLPKTDFPMRAELPKREPAVLARWEEMGLYTQILRKNKDKPAFTLHDGPPYANGTIHFGHILNKVLKDMVVKYKNLSGWRAEFVPGWDCHGLPIELGVDKRLDKKKREMSPAQIRRECRAYAQEFIDLQRADFKRLGILARWEKPYLTMNPGYEATIAREIGKIHQHGFLNKGYKPVHWCSSCATALAEAEVEYELKTSPSIYVLFKASSDLDLGIDLENRPVYYVIWTTTPWTLPANVAIAAGDAFHYAAVAHNGNILIVAKDLIPNLETLLKTPLPVQSEFIGETLTGDALTAEHPFLPRTARVVAGHHVSLDTGTGLVHIAPGHGMDDYKIGLQYTLPTRMPVDARGRFTADVGVPEWVGQPIFAANEMIVEALRARGRLLFSENISHSYPHCWRCKKPVIFRATEQWFILLDHEYRQGTLSVRKRALEEIDKTRWIPEWGRNRIHSMVSDRPDWCVSRQRLWGVPIPAFYCQNDHLLFTPEVVEHIAKQFEDSTSDIWYDKTEAELLPVGTVCPTCSSATFRKDPNILDVWFDSGVSHAAVLDHEPGLTNPADLYLEGSDQHRGWFHSSLLTSVATRGQAPYKAVLTHGFVVDEHGRKYSKSAKNYVPPEKIVNEMGADLLRLWVSAEDYRNDIRLSKTLFDQLSEAYRKIRNTCRFMLGNLYDFDRATHNVARSERLDIDRYAITQLGRLLTHIADAYSAYEFHQVYHLLNQYCVVTLSAEYLDILKDRLYTFNANSHERRSAQSTLFEIVETLTVAMAPILSFTAEEIWQHLPAFAGKADSVFLSESGLDLALPTSEVTPLEDRFLALFTLRDEVLKALEKARKDKLIAHSLEAKVVLTVSATLDTLFDRVGIRRDAEDWPSLFITSQVEWVKALSEATFISETYDGLKIQVLRADGDKCPRCWNYATTIGQSPAYLTLCHRCAAALA